MRRQHPNRSRRALSAVVLTLILLGLAVVGGGIVYTVFQSQSNTVSQKAQIGIEGLSIVKTSAGDNYLSLTVKDSGNKKFTAVEADLQTVPVFVMSTGSGQITPSTINPGQSASGYVKITPLTNQTIIGQTIPINIKATTEDGSIVTTSTSVVVQLG